MKVLNPGPQGKHEVDDDKWHHTSPDGRFFFANFCMLSHFTVEVKLTAYFRTRLRFAI